MGVVGRLAAREWYLLGVGRFTGVEGSGDADPRVGEGGTLARNRPPTGTSVAFRRGAENVEPVVNLLFIVGHQCQKFVPRFAIVGTRNHDNELEIVFSPTS
ncbi:hypothetical protein HYQ46_004524 [Verticillium longisporum]|nr:hypothetical protein HYQ46_004524 [Verticillium longisporum]